MKSVITTFLAVASLCLSLTASAGEPERRNEVTAFVYHWFALFDRNAPVQEFLPLLSEQELAMRFPERELRSREEFSDWYAGILKTFKSASHRIESLQFRPGLGGRIRLHVTVYWSAVAYDGTRAAMRAEQDWQLERTSTGKLVIKSYLVTPGKK